MLVCHCRKICDRTIRECIDRGARTVEDVGQACQAGTVCGGCRPTISALVAGEPVDAGVISLGKARVRERATEVQARVQGELEVEVAVVRPAVARAS